MIAFAFMTSGYLLISSSFNAHLQSETDRALEGNLLLQLAYEGGASTYTKENAKINRDIVISIAEQLDNEGARLICIADKDLDLIYTNFKSLPDYSLMQPSLQELIYKIKKNNNRYYVYVTSYMNVGEKPVYLQTISDITNVFSQREKQFDNYVLINLTVLMASSVFTVAIALILTRPIKKLSASTRRIAQGEYSERAKVLSDDEIGSFTKDFNNMANALEEKIHALELSARQKDEFVASFAHELKTPLTSIIGYADMMRSTNLDAQSAFDAANYIFSEGKRLESLSIKLLELIVLNKQQFRKKSTNMRLLIDSVAKTVMPVMDGAGIRLVWHAQDAVTDIEPDLMKTLLINLIDNARKASKSGDVIEVSGTLKNSDYDITIKDTGYGIPKEELDKITEAFYMVDKSRSRSQNGAGLGLALCEAIARLHKSRLEFFSEVGVGTTVRLKIPCAQGVKDIETES